MGCCDKKNPISRNIWDQLVDLSLTAANAIQLAAKTGRVAALQDIVEARLKICNSCGQLRVTRCAACGCWIHLKVAVQVSQCPKKKW